MSEMTRLTACRLRTLLFNFDLHGFTFAQVAMPVVQPLTTLQGVLLRHEKSRGSIVDEAEITPRPSTASRRMATAQRNTNEELDGRAEQLSSVLEGVRVGVDSTLADLRRWRAERDAHVAADRERYATEIAQADYPVSVQGASVRADPLGEGLDHAQVERLCAMLGQGSKPERHERPTIVAAENDNVSAEGLVSAKLDANLALQRRLERDLMAKYGISESDATLARADDDSRSALSLQVSLSRYAAGLDSLLDEM